MSALSRTESRTLSTFAVVAEAQPGALERVVAVLGRGFPVPRRLTCVHHDRSGRMALNVVFIDLDPVRAELLAARLRGLVGVEKVFVATSEDGAA
ncbi:MAG: hypothetical protein ACREER_08085 [Alphaproteobacteria bacterium]